MEWMYSSSGFFVFSCFLFATCNADFPTGAIRAIRCTLSQTVPDDCAGLLEVTVPSYLVQEYNDSPSNVHEALRSGQLTRLSILQITQLPLSLLYLIPRSRLRDLNGTQLGAIVLKHPNDTSLAHQVAVSVQHGKHLLQLMHKLQVHSLSQDVLNIMGESINLLDINNDDFFKSLPNNEQPILAYLRPTMLLKLKRDIFYKVMFRLELLTILPRKENIYFITDAVIRNANYPFKKPSWLVLGLTPDKLKEESLILNLNSRVFRLNFNSMQARAVFERMYKNVTLRQSEYIDCHPLLSKLSPTLLQKFPDREHKYDALIDLPFPSSLPTALQITEYIMADCKLTGKLPNDDQPWGQRIKYLKKWVYTLPLSAIKDYLDSPLNTSQLQTIESLALSSLQAYYLTGRGLSLDVKAANSILELDAFLHALPASQLISHKVGDISSNVQEHLVANLPADNLPRTISLVHKIASGIGESFILDNLLDNKDVNDIMGIISPMDLQASASRMLKLFANSLEQAHVIRQLPQPVLTALLDHARKNSNWRWRSLLDKSHVSHLLIGGLTCQDMKEMDIGLFIPIIAQYNRQRQQAFPKNLQHCCFQKLMRHLEFKMALSQTDSRKGLISVLEPVEIESVGGYILVGLPVDSIKVSPYLNHILETIGKLSNAEMMLAANMSHIQAIAKLAVTKEGNVDVFVAGNLVWFLPPNAKIPELKLMLESGSLDTTLCLPIKSRHIIATKLLTHFGPPNTWSSGVLTTLQDLLLVFTENELNNISKATWTEAGDCLLSRYSNSVHWIESLPFYQVCAKILEKSEEFEYKLSVARLVRWHLKAAQWLLDTVKNTLGATINMIPVSNSILEDESEVFPSVFSPTEVRETDTQPIEESESFEIEDIPEDDTSLEDEVTETVHSTTIESKKTEIETNKNYENEKITDTAMSSENDDTFEDSKASENAIIENETTMSSKNYDTTKDSVTYKNKKTTIETTKTSENENITEGRITHKNISSEFNTLPEDRNIEPVELNPSTTEGEKANKDISNTEKAIKNNTTNNSSESIPKISTTEEYSVTISSEDSLFPQKTTVSSKSTLHNHDQEETYSITPLKNNTSTSTMKSNTKTIVLNAAEENTNKSFEATKMENNYKLNISELATAISSTDRSSFPTKSENITQEHVLINISSTTIGPLNLDHSKGRTNEFAEDNDDVFDENNDEMYDPNESVISREKRSFQYENSVKLTCNALKMVGRQAALALTEKDLEKMSDTEINDCRVQFGAMELSVKLQKHIWKREINKKDGVHLLGKLLRAATVGDLWDIDFDIKVPWALENIHALKKNVNNSLVITKLLEQIESSNSDSDFPPELLAVLGDSLCALESTKISKLTVVGLEPFTQCPHCLPNLAQMAVQQLGPVSHWDQHHVHVLHTIVAGLELEDWKTLVGSPYKPITALQPSAVRCLNISHIEVLSPHQIKMIPTLTLHALSQQQIAALNATQFRALKNATQFSIPQKLIPSKDILVAGVSSASSLQLATGSIIIFKILLSLLHSV